ncbi:hypothetical protein GEMRC1_011928 [Eukaryota sp. GEM-RC1]
MTVLLVFLVICVALSAAGDVLIGVPFNPWKFHHKNLFSINVASRSVKLGSAFPEVTGVGAAVMDRRDNYYIALGMSISYKPIAMVFNSSNTQRVGDIQFPYTPNDPQNCRYDDYRKQIITTDVLARTIWNLDCSKAEFEEVFAWTIKVGDEDKPDPSIEMSPSDQSAINPFISKYYVQMRNKTEGIDYIATLNYRTNELESIVPIDTKTKGWFYANGLYAFSTSGDLGKIDLATGKWEFLYRFGHLPWLETVDYSPDTNTVYASYMEGAEYFVSGINLETLKETCKIKLPESLCYLRVNNQ